jgi:hypothetical protein
MNGGQGDQLMEPKRTDLPGLPGWPRGDAQPSVPVDAEVVVEPPPWAVPALHEEPTKQTPPVASRAGGPTLTQQVRVLQPPDVARQAISELGVLAREMDALPESLVDAGLAAECLPAYREVLRDYLDLSHYAWEAIAEEQLEHAGAEPDYRQHAVRVARGITRLAQAADQARPASGSQRGARVPFLMRRRVRLVREGLVQWQTKLVPVPDPQSMGRALFVLQGYISLATAGALELVLLDLLVSVALALTGLLALGTVLLLLAIFFSGTTALIPAAATLALTCVLAWGITLLVTTNRTIPLELLLGASVFSRRRAACLGWQGSSAIAVLLRGWWLLVCGLAVLAVPVGIVLGGGLLAANEPFPVPNTALQMVDLTGGILYVALILPAAAAFCALILLALPFALAAMVRFAREMAGNPYWVPKARRYGLRPALAVLIFVTVLLLGAIAGVGNMLGWQHVGLLTVSLGPIKGGTLTLRGLVLVLGGLLPYLLLFDLPYRLGIRRWRAQRLTDLESRRADLESQVRRLATQDPSDDLLRAMQYDLVLLQFYKSQMDEARTISTAPFRVEGRVIVVLISFVGGLLVDGFGGFAVHLLSVPR